MATPGERFACTLEDGALVARIQAWQHVTKQALTRRVEEGRVVATYPNDPELLQQLRDLIAAEAACCSFLEFSLVETPDALETELRLPPEMPPPMKDLILELVGTAR